MKKAQLLSFSIFFLFAFSFLSGQQKVRFEGKIDKYSIEMELHPTTDKDDNIAGRYRYAGKDSWLSLSGFFAGDRFIYLDEYWKQDTTGHFYLQIEEGKHWTGKWTTQGKGLDVSLMVVEGDPQSLKPWSMEELKEDCNDDISGSYLTQYYFVNDWFFSEENPTVEVGYNGGVVSVELQEDDSLLVKFDLLCGPTYHIASLSAKAAKTGPNTWVYNKTYYGDGPCHLIFTFKDKVLTIEQESPSFDCGFGARAYAGGTFTKVNNKTFLEEDGYPVSIKKVLENR